MTKIIQLVLIMIAELLCKNWRQKIMSFCRCLMWKKQGIWLTEKILRPTLKNQFAASMNAYPYAKKSASWLNSFLTYYRFKIDKYFWQAQVCLTKPIWMNWFIQMYLWMANHMQKSDSYLSSFWDIANHCYYMSDTTYLE